MIKELIGKNVEIIVSHSHYTLHGGSSPIKYMGVLLETDENYAKFRIFQAREQNDIIISLKYLVSLKKL